VIAVPKAAPYELYKLLRMPEVGLEPSLPGGNRILSHCEYPFRGPRGLWLQDVYRRLSSLFKGFPALLPVGRTPLYTRGFRILFTTYGVRLSSNGSGSEGDITSTSNTCSHVTPDLRGDGLGYGVRVGGEGRSPFRVSDLRQVVSNRRCTSRP
jgi:hypothetical protein